jgi:hypothetical protein
VRFYEFCLRLRDTTLVYRFIFDNIFKMKSSLLTRVVFGSLNLLMDDKKATIELTELTGLDVTDDMLNKLTYGRSPCSLSLIQTIFLDASATTWRT